MARFLFIILWLFPSWALAVEVEPLLEVQTTWTDNLFTAQFDEESDFSVRVSPGFRVKDDGPSLKWKFEYRPSYEYYVDESDLRAWDHETKTSIEYGVTARLSLGLVHDFARFRRITRFNDASETGVASSSELRSEGSPFERHSGTLFLAYALSPVDQLQASYTLFDFDFRDENRTDVFIQSGALAWSRQLSRLLSAGLTLQYTKRENEPDVGGVTSLESEAEFYKAAAEFVWNVDKDFLIELSMGPGWVKSSSPELMAPPLVGADLFPSIQGQAVDVTTCPTFQDEIFGDTFSYLGSGCEALNAPDFSFPGVLAFAGSIPEADDSATTFFGRLSIKRAWKNWNGEITLQRSDDQSTGVGASSVADMVAASLSYRPFRDWTLRGWSSFVRRSNEAETVSFVQQVNGYLGSSRAIATQTRAVILDSDSEIETFRFGASARWQASPKLSISLLVAWFEEENQISGTVFREADRFTAWLGFRYTFSSLRF